MSILLLSTDLLEVGKINNVSILGYIHNVSILPLHYLSVLDSSHASNSLADKAFIDTVDLPSFLVDALDKNVKSIFDGHYSRHINKKVKSYQIADNNRFITLVDLAEILTLHYMDIVTIGGIINVSMVNAFHNLINAIDMVSSRRRNFHNRPLPAH